MDRGVIFGSEKAKKNVRLQKKSRISLVQLFFDEHAHEKIRNQIEGIDPSVRLPHKWVHVSSSSIRLISTSATTRLILLNFYAKICFL